MGLKFIDPLDPAFLEERKLRFAIYRNNNNSYEAEVLNAFSYTGVDRVMVTDIMMTIPKSYVHGLGMQLFNSFLVKLFLILGKPQCQTPNYAILKLKRYYRKLVSRLLSYASEIESKYCRKVKRSINRSLMLAWFQNSILELINALWRASKIHYKRLAVLKREDVWEEFLEG